MPGSMGSMGLWRGTKRDSSRGGKEEGGGRRGGGGGGVGGGKGGGGGGAVSTAASVACEIKCMVQPVKGPRYAISLHRLAYRIQVISPYKHLQL